MIARKKEGMAFLWWKDIQNYEDNVQRRKRINYKVWILTIYCSRMSSVCLQSCFRMIHDDCNDSWLKNNNNDTRRGRANLYLKMTTSVTTIIWQNRVSNDSWVFLVSLLCFSLFMFFLCSSSSLKESVTTLRTNDKWLTGEHFENSSAFDEVTLASTFVTTTLLLMMTLKRQQS